MTKDGEAQYQTNTSTTNAYLLGVQEKGDSISSLHEPSRVQYLGNKNHRQEEAPEGEKKTPWTLVIIPASQ